jgi:hypothetical protein
MGIMGSSRKTIGHRNNSRHNLQDGRCGNRLLGILALLVVGLLYLMMFADSGNDYGEDATKHLKTLDDLTKARAIRARAAVNTIKESPSSDEKESDQDGDASDEKQDNEEGGQDGDNSPDEENGDPDDLDEGNGDPDEPDTDVEGNDTEDQDQENVSDKENGDEGEVVDEDQDGGSESASSDFGEGNDTEEEGEEVARR